MKRFIYGMMAIGLLTGCTTNAPEKANTTQEKVVKNEQNDDQYIKVSIESANSLTSNASELKTLLDNMDVENEDWQTDVEATLLHISMAVNDYEIVELDLTDEQSVKFKETKDLFSESIMSFEDIIQDSKKALETYDKRVLEYIRDLQLNQANSLILKAKEQLETERY